MNIIIFIIIKVYKLQWKQMNFKRNSKMYWQHFRIFPEVFMSWVSIAAEVYLGKQQLKFVNTIEKIYWPLLHLSKWKCHPGKSPVRQIGRLAHFMLDTAILRGLLNRDIDQALHAQLLSTIDWSQRHSVIRYCNLLHTVTMVMDSGTKFCLWQFLQNCCTTFDVLLH